MEQEKRPFLTISENGMYVDLEVADQDDLVEMLTQCINSRTLWFKFTYNLYGSLREIHPRQLIRAREMTQEQLDNFIKERTQELRYSTDVRVLMLQPDELDRKNLY